MTDSNRSLTEVPALIEERRRYEGWLAALATRRDTTPAHVFERVQADYQGRLERVNERLASHRQAIDEERISVQSRVTLLEAEERLHRDERAELELRAHVGELVGGDAESAFRAVDEAVEQLVTEKDSLTVRIAELQGLLSSGSAVSAQVEPPAPETVARPVDAPPASEPRKTPDAPAQASHPPGEQSSGPRSSFDELAFLSSVVGQNDSGPLVEHRTAEPLLSAPAGVAHDEPTENSLLAGLENAKHPTGEHPLAANVTANAPLILRSSTTVEQSKTLKCNECGALNYPTEWYCERCGAELAAL